MDWCQSGLSDPKRYRCPGGLRSEPINSRAFDADGYWRGALWPVTVFIFSEAWRACDRTSEADDLERDYLLHLHAEGNFENYRGDTGEGVRDAGIAWTASCALWFLNRSFTPLQAGPAPGG